MKLKPFCPIPDSADRYCAVRLCPTTMAVKQGVTRLVDAIENHDFRNRYSYHNYYTLYTVLLFGYTTMIRGVHSPLVAPPNISKLNNLALVWDKSSEAGDKVKLTYIPPLLEKQLRFYETHLHEYMGLPSKWDWCFVGSEWEIEEVSPKTIQQHLSEFLPGFPPAVHRRVTFNALLELGCPAEVVRVAMGHATVGDEPYSGWSTLSFSRVRRIIAPFLEKVCELLGFTQAIKGRRK